MNKSNIISFLPTYLIYLIFISLNLNMILDYKLNMKIGHYYNYILDVLIPCVSGIWILITSALICNFNDILTNKLSLIGMNTLPIMYLHIQLNELIQKKISYGTIGFILIWIVPTLIFNFICSKHKCLEILFKGKVTSKVDKRRKKIIMNCH